MKYGIVADCKRAKVSPQFKLVTFNQPLFTDFQPDSGELTIVERVRLRRLADACCPVAPEA
jgi:hypothetical protein